MRNPVSAHKDFVKTMDRAGTPAHKPVVARSDPPLQSSAEGAAWRARPHFRGILGTLAIVALTTIIAHLLEVFLPPPSLVLLFLVGVLAASVRYGFWTGIIASVVTFLAYDFFFVEPHHTLSVNDAGDVLTLLVLLGAGAVTGFLAGRLRETADAAASRARTLELMSGFTHDLTSSTGASEVKTTMLEHLVKTGGGSAVILQARNDGLHVELSKPAAVDLGADDLQAADRAFRRDSDEAPAAPGWGGSAMTFRPLGAEHGVVGYTRSRWQRDEKVRRAIVEQGRLALEKIRLAKDAEREAMKAALLSSLSHDLKTPLATILGGVSSLRELGSAMSPESRADLLLAVEEETQRLSRFVGDLLHLTRLNAGLDPQLDWIDIADAVHGAAERARRIHAGRSIAVDVPHERPLVLSSAVLLEQALFNLVDNALKFSAADSAVRVLVALEDESLRITVADQGPGIPPADLPRVFEPFFRGPDNRTAGTGLGLSIAQGIVRVLSGSLTIESPVRDQKGSQAVIRLPLAKTRG